MTTHYNTVGKAQASAPITSPDMQKFIVALLMPDVKIKEFDGSPLEYWTFIRFFDESVGKTSVDTRKKLTRLISSCVAKAADAITHCNIMEAEEGYKEARRILKARFGNDLLIRGAWLNKITGGTIVKEKDEDALQTLTDEVRNRTYTLKAMGQDMSNMYEKVILVFARLPQYSRNRWRPKFIEYVKREGKYPTLENLLEFLEGAALEMTDPLLQLLDKVTLERNNSRTTVALAANTKVGEDSDYKQVCVLCNKNHWLQKFKLFLYMNLNERLDYATIKGLSYNCLRSSDHIASYRRSCTTRRARPGRATSLDTRTTAWETSKRPSGRGFNWHTCRKAM